MSKVMVSEEELAELERAVNRSKTQAIRLRDKADAAVREIVSTVEMSTAAFGMGVVDGRWGGVEVLGVPLSLGSAGVAHLVAFLGVAPEHLRAFGNGFLANYLTTLGNGVGAKMAVEAQKQIQAAAAQQG